MLLTKKTISPSFLSGIGIYMLLHIFLLGCQVVELRNDNTVNIEPNQSYQDFDRIMVTLNENDNADTVFNGKFTNNSNLHNLNSTISVSSIAKIEVWGYSGEQLEYFEVRRYDRSSKKLIDIDIVENAGIPLIKDKSDDISIFTGKEISLFVTAFDFDGNIDSIYWDIDNYMDWDIKGEYENNKSIKWTYKNSGQYQINIKVIDKHKKSATAVIRADIKGKITPVIIPI